MMYEKIRYFASWTSVNVSKKIGQRGAEMVEYAIVLACIAAVGVLYYATGSTGSGDNVTAKGALGQALMDLWKKINTSINGI